MAGAVLGPMGRWFSTSLDAELFRWRRRTGGRTLVLRPDRAFSATVGGGLRCLMNPERTPAVYDAARRLGLSQGRRHLAGLAAA
jgi:hypothetical protein